MRYLVLSDIHANLAALDAVLDRVKGRWQEVVCLGDLVGYGPDPNEVIERVRSLGAIAIRGNHDKVASGLTGAEDFNPVARDAALWTRGQLKAGNREYLEKLPRGPLEVEGFSIVHGAFHDEDEYVFGPAEALEGLLSMPLPVAFFGHTHLQGGFAVHGEKMDVMSLTPKEGRLFVTLTLRSGTNYLLNPGSVGQPRDGDPRSAFAIADLNNQSVEFYRVPYDIEALQKRMERAGLPETLILRLSSGR